jgi:hypothetical protein
MHLNVNSLLHFGSLLVIGLLIVAAFALLIVFFKLFEKDLFSSD